MPVTHSFKTLAFRVRIKPAPRTQSESNAVLRFLQDLGPISSFQIPHYPRIQSAVNNDEVGDSVVANLIFAHNTKFVDELRSGNAKRRFAVVANANIPVARVKDPFNVQGLQNRKPELQPQEFQCHITPAADEPQHILKAVSDNEYRGTFAVDRSSIFAEILAKTDCPSGLIHGLLPKLEDKHRMQTHGLSSKKIQDDRNEKESTTPDLESPGGRKARRKTRFIQLDVRRLQNEDPTTATDDAAHKEEAKSHDEFAALRDVSLMRMYREATARTSARETRLSDNFAPFPDSR